MELSLSRRTRYVILGCILVTAFILRIYGIGFGLPYSFHDDEDRLVHHALAFGMGDLNPHYFNYPSFLMYVLFGLYGVFYAVGSISGHVASTSAFAALYLKDPTAFYLIGRALSLLMGLGTVLVTYLIGRRIYSEKAGLFSAAIMAVLCSHVESSHFITTDVPLTFFVVLAAYFSLDILHKGRIRDYIAAALMTGLAAGCKYNGVLACVFIITAHVARQEGTRQKLKSLANPRLIASGIIVLLTFLAVSPYCLLDFRSFIADVRFDSEHVRTGVYGLSGGVQWLGYLRMLFSDLPYSWPAEVFSTFGILVAAGMVCALIMRRREEAVLGVFPLLFFLLVGSWGVLNRRYMLPLLPFCAVFAGAAIWRLSLRYGKQLAGRSVVWALAGLMLLLPLKNAVLGTHMMARKDTRVMAREWIEAEIPAGSSIALEWDANTTVPLDESRQSIAEKIEAYESGESSTIHFDSSQMVKVHKLRMEAAGDDGYRIVRIGGVEGVEILPELYSLEELRSQGVETVVVSGIVAATFQSEKGKETYPVQSAFYRQLEESCELLCEFHPVPGKTPGPPIRIYSIAGDGSRIARKVN